MLAQQLAFTGMVLVFTTLLATCSTILLARARITRSPSPMFLGFFFLSLIGYYITMFIARLGLPVPAIVNVASIELFVLFGLLFLFKTFCLLGNPSRYLILVPVFLLAIGNVSFAMVLDVTSMTVVGDTGRAACTGAQVFIVSLAQARYTFRDARVLRLGATAPRVVARYIAFGFVSVLGMGVAVTSTIGYMLASTTLVIARELADMVTMILVLTYCSLNFAIWVSPGWFRGKNGLQRAGEIDPDSVPVSGRLVPVVDFFGEYLSGRIGQSPSATKGFLLLTIKEEIGDRGWISGKELETVFSGPLALRLETTGVDQAREITRDMVDLLRKAKSLFTMANA